MKQLLPLFLFLLPCLAWAQYPSNGNQKITLGEQTTADGLIWRGVATDTARKPSIDTMAYMVLDTTTNIIWHYKKATSNAWLRLNLLPSDTASMLTNYWRSGRFNGVLPVANGGTGSTTQNFVDLTTTQTVEGEKTFNGNLAITNGSPKLFFNDNAGGDRFNYSFFNNFGLFYLRDESANKNVFSIGGGEMNLDVLANFNAFVTSPSFRPTGTTSTGNAMYLPATNTLGFSTASNIRMSISSTGAVTINNLSGINDVGADANGVLQAATSDMNLKNTIENSPFGLNEILLLNPVSFLYNDTNRKIDSDVKEVGFIAQDVFDIIPNAVSSTGMGDLQLDYRAITATLVKAIQEQNLLIKSLEQRIINLENK
jgi:hypothetical protein